LRVTNSSAVSSSARASFVRPTSRCCQSEDRLRVALKAARMGVWEQDLETGALDWSPQMERLFGLPVGGFKGHYEDFLALVHPEDHQRVVATVAEAFRTASACDLEYRALRSDGSIRWIASFGEPARDGDRPVKLAGVAIDITERKQVEERAIRLAHHDALTSLPNRRLSRIGWNRP
jgi:PAS domain S-box-containing protein